MWIFFITNTFAQARRSNFRFCRGLIAHEFSSKNMRIYSINFFLLFTFVHVLSKLSDNAIYIIISVKSVQK